MTQMVRQVLYTERLPVQFPVRYAKLMLDNSIEGIQELQKLRDKLSYIQKV